MLILEIYRHRPAHMSHMHFGQWFCNALEEPDVELYECYEINKALALIEEKYHPVDFTVFIKYNGVESVKTKPTMPYHTRQPQRQNVFYSQMCG